MQVETAFPASDGTPMPAVLTVPDGVDGPVPGLLTVYEIFGMSDEMRRVARDLAAVGYAVAGHSFFTRTPGVRRLPIHAEHHEASAQDAHRRVVTFFEEHLANS